MMKKYIEGLLYEEAGQAPKQIKAHNSLLELQRLIGGYIEVVTLPGCGGAIAICDEEGKLKGLPPTRELKGKDGHAYDLLCGRFFVCGQNGSEFDSLSVNQRKLVTEYFKEEHHG